MIVVIQCAGSKRCDAGYLLTASGKPVTFVADARAAALADPANEYARPDDPSDTGASWRQMLKEYNAKYNPDYSADSKNNPLGLYPAYRLYKNPIYDELVARFCLQKVYILSAGWGFIRAGFLTPYYDITFNRSSDKPYRRRPTDHYEDFSILPRDAKEDILFFGGRDYVALFIKLTDSIGSKKTVFYNSADAPDAIGYTFVKCPTTARTNWHYGCARKFLQGKIKIP
jgi:hypothetical protein